MPTVLRFTIILTLFLLGFFAHSQEINGRIVDAKTGEPVPFATVQYGIHQGVISNMEGYFNFFNKNADYETVLTISAMGYVGQQLTVKQLDAKRNIIRLAEALNQLSTVYVSNQRPNADTIMQRVNRNLPQNYNPNNAQFTLFTRQSSFFKPSTAIIEIDKSTGFSKAKLQESNRQLQALATNVINRPPAQRYVDILSNLYVGEGENEKIKVVKATKLLDVNNKVSFENIQQKATDIILKHLDATKTYKLKTGLFTLEDSLSVDFKEKKEDKKDEKTIDYGNVKNELAKTISTAMFNKDTELDFITELKNYEYELEEITDFNGQLVYVLSFKPDRHRAKFAGKIYVSKEDYGILKIEYNYAEGKMGEKINLKLLLGIKFAEDVKSGTIIYTKNDETHIYYPRYINQQTGQYLYVHRPLKFIENNDESKNKVAFDFVIEGHMMEKTELLNTATNSLDSAAYNQLKESNTEEYQLLTQYDPSIWESINSLEPLQEMKQFKVEGNQ